MNHGRPRKGTENRIEILYEHGYGVEEIARILGLAESTVLDRLKRMQIYDRPITKTYLKRIGWGKWEVKEELMDLVLGETYKIKARNGLEDITKRYILADITEKGLFIFENQKGKNEAFTKFDLMQMWAKGQLKRGK
jgi:predicted DNA-binding protein YlxM (UPF0122 family)